MLKNDRIVHFRFELCRGAVPRLKGWAVPIAGRVGNQHAFGRSHVFMFGSFFVVMSQISSIDTFLIIGMLIGLFIQFKLEPLTHSRLS